MLDTFFFCFSPRNPSCKHHPQLSWRKVGCGEMSGFSTLFRSGWSCSCFTSLDWRETKRLEPYIPRTHLTSLFGGLNLPFYMAQIFPNMGHLCSRYIYIYALYGCIPSLKTTDSPVQIDGWKTLEWFDGSTPVVDLLVFCWRRSLAEKNSAHNEEHRLDQHPPSTYF